jgi:hypothetical protein
MLEREALMLLARSYRDKTGIGRYELGKKVAPGNERLFVRLERGEGCNSKTGAKALFWFAEHWPDDLPWPRSVYRPAVPDPVDQPEPSCPASAS